MGTETGLEVIKFNLTFFLIGQIQKLLLMKLEQNFIGFLENVYFRRAS